MYMLFLLFLPIFRLLSVQCVCVSYSHFSYPVFVFSCNHCCCLSEEERRTRRRCFALLYNVVVNCTMNGKKNINIQFLFIIIIIIILLTRFIVCFHISSSLSTSDQAHGNFAANTTSFASASLTFFLFLLD